MRSAPLAYRRRASPLHAASGPVAAFFAGAIALCALLSENPLVLGALLAAAFGAAAGAGVARPIARVARRSALPVLALTVLVNLLVSRNGLTVFARLGEWGPLGQVDLTVEALVYGLVFGLRLLVVMLACSLIICVADPDELLIACRRFWPRSALTVSLATRLLPVLAQDARRLAEAQRCRPDGGPRASAAKVAVLRAAVGGALDRALDVAAVLEMRGYGSPQAPRRRARRSISLRRRSRHDLAFAAAAAALVALGLSAAVSDAAPYHAYPLVSVAVGPRVLVLCALLLASALAPFADRRGIER